MALVKGARARSETFVKPPWAVLPSQCVGPELCRLPAQPRGPAQGRTLLSLKLSVASLFKTSRIEVKACGRGEDLQGMETPMLMI